jgi:hypothetical protein
VRITNGEMHRRFYFWRFPFFWAQRLVNLRLTFQTTKAYKSKYIVLFSNGVILRNKKYFAFLKLGFIPYQLR